VCTTYVLFSETYVERDAPCSLFPLWHKKCLVIAFVTNLPYRETSRQRAKGDHLVLRKEKFLEAEDGFGGRNSEKEKIADALTSLSDDLKAAMKSGAGQKDLLEILGEGAQKIGALRDSLTEPFKIAIVGAQGTGKSTLINLLLGEPIMISHFDETEGSIIKLTHTEDASREKKASIHYFTDQEGVYRQEWISRDEFYTRVDLSTKRELKKDAVYRDSIAFFEIYSRNPLLRTIQFINTPGLNTVTADFIQRVKHLFIEADVILWMNKRNQILDAFNSRLIPQIHRDNGNIIGILGFADDLYQSDSVNGVRDVLKEFFKETEKNMLLRRESGGKKRVCFFVYNGLAAESALGMKSDRILSNSEDILPGEEAQLRMFWNYLRHGFPFSDEGSVVDEFLLWNPDPERGTTERTDVAPFDRDQFIQWLCANRFIKRRDRGYTLTGKGRILFFETSMLPAIETFAQDVIFNRSLQEKMSKLKDKISRLYGPQNILSVIRKKRSEYQKVIEEKDAALAKAQKEWAALKVAIRQNYREWYLARIQRHSRQMSQNLVGRILQEIGERIGKKDLWKEFLKQMTPQIFSGDGEGPVMKEISKIVDEEFEALAEANTQRIITEALEEAKHLIAELTPGSFSDEKVRTGEFKTGKGKTNAVRFKVRAKQATFDDAGIHEVMKGLMDQMGKMVSGLVKKMAASDMRKKGMTKFGKLFAKMFRKIVIKLSVDYAKEHAQIAPAQGIPFVGWLLIIKDLVDLGLMLNDMLDDLKGKLEEAIQENEDDFFEHFRRVLEPAYEEAQNAIFEGLEETFKSRDREAEKALKAIGLCDRVIHIFEAYQPRFEAPRFPAPPGEKTSDGERKITDSSLR
jgi:hypothetical protein